MVLYLNLWSYFLIIKITITNYNNYTCKASLLKELKVETFNHKGISE